MCVSAYSTVLSICVLHCPLVSRMSVTVVCCPLSGCDTVRSATYCPTADVFPTVPLLLWSSSCQYTLPHSYLVLLQQPGEQGDTGTRTQLCASCKLYRGMYLEVRSKFNINLGNYQNLYSSCMYNHLSGW